MARAKQRMKNPVRHYRKKAPAVKLQFHCEGQELSFGLTAIHFDWKNGKRAKARKEMKAG
jgi:hypothetical protein